MSSAGYELNNSILLVLPNTVKHMLAVALQAIILSRYATELLLFYMFTYSSRTRQKS